MHPCFRVPEATDMTQGPRSARRPSPLSALSAWSCQPGECEPPSAVSNGFKSLFLEPGRLGSRHLPLTLRRNLPGGPMAPPVHLPQPSPAPATDAQSRAWGSFSPPRLAQQEVSLESRLTPACCSLLLLRPQAPQSLPLIPAP